MDSIRKDPLPLFFQVKGVIEGISGYCHCDELTFKEGVVKPTWADSKVYLNIMMGKEVVGAIADELVGAAQDAIDGALETADNIKDIIDSAVSKK